MRARDYHVWSDDERSALRTMTADGMTAVECAAALSMSVGAIHNQREQLRCGPLMNRTPTLRPVAHFTPPDGPTLAEVFAPESSRDETDGEFLARVRPMAARSLEKAAAQRHSLGR